MTKHPKITPRRALDLLTTLERNRNAVPYWLVNRLCDALYEHVAAHLSKRRRRA